MKKVRVGQSQESHYGRSQPTRRRRKTCESHPLLQSPPEEGTTLANLSGIVKQVKKERDRIQHQSSGLNAALAAFAEVYKSGSKTKPRRKLSAQGRARISAAQRARWAKVNGQQKVVLIATPKRTMS